MARVTRVNASLLALFVAALAACTSPAPQAKVPTQQRPSPPAPTPHTRTPALPPPSSPTPAQVEMVTPAPSIPPSSELPFPANIRIAYSHALTAPLYVIREDGTELFAIAGLGQAVDCGVFPAWSPDGTRLAFQCYDAATGNADIYESDLTGSVITRLTTSESFDTQPVWSPDGWSIAFRSQPTPYGWNLLVLDLSLSRVTTVATVPPNETGATDAAFDWSPDGQRLVFYDSSEGARIYVVNADATGKVRLLPTYAADPDWSPLDDRIAYVGEDGIRILGLADHRDVLALPGVGLGSPKWSPDGLNIAATEFSEDGGLLLYQVETHTNRKALAGTHILSYCWAPDSVRIAFVGSDGDPPTWSIYLLDIRNGDLAWVAPIDPYVFDDIACQP